MIMKMKILAGLAAILLATAFSPAHADGLPTAGSMASLSDSVGTGLPPFEAEHADRTPATLTLGALVGYPAGMNLAVGLETSLIGVHVSGGSWGSSWSGAQGDLGVYFAHTQHLSVGIAVIAGTYTTNPRLDSGQRSVLRQTYAGPALECSLAGFFVQAGVAFGHGDYPSSQLSYQFGYAATIF